MYEIIFQISERINDGSLCEKHIQLYVKEITSNKYEFIDYIYNMVVNNRAKRTIRISRLIESLSIFQICLNLIQGNEKNKLRKLRSPEIVNLLGFSCANVVFYIKLLMSFHKFEE